MSSGRWATVAAAVILAAAGPVEAAGGGEGDDAVSVSVSPSVAIQPAWITVRVFVEPDPDNRTLEVVAESVQFFRSSEKQLDGDRASRTSVFRYRDLPAGEYDIRAVLIGRDGVEQAIARAKLKVHP